MTCPTLTIPDRFNGPPRSAQGGYACGRLAALAASHLDGPARVTLHAPVPLQTRLEYHVSGRRGYASARDELIATVSRAGLAAAPPQPVPLTEATAAHAGFAGQAGHPFPTCFACGSNRPGDGLNLRPGPVRGRAGMVACAWFPDPALAGPDGMVPPEIVWSILDCPGGWTSDLVRVPRVLASMAARITALPRAGAGYVITGQLVTMTARTITSTTALYDAGALDGAGAGDPLASATSIWVAV